MCPGEATPAAYATTVSSTLKPAQLPVEEGGPPVPPLGAPDPELLIAGVWRRPSLHSTAGCGNLHLALGVCIGTMSTYIAIPRES